MVKGMDSGSWRKLRRGVQLTLAKGWFGHHTFRSQLMLLNGLAVGLAIILTGIGLIGLQWFNGQEQSERRFHQVAAVIGANVAPAILFDDRAAAAENLASVHGIGDIGWLEATTTDQRVFASYAASSTAKTDRDRWEAVSRYPIKADGETVGTLVMGVHYPSIGDILRANAAVAAAIGLVAMVIVGVISLSMNKIAYRPIDRLIAAMRRISGSEDYSVRLATDPDPDFNAISTSFNTMLEQVEVRQTALTETADQLRTARDEAENANLAKSQFLANMSHELRTPLNAIIGYAEVLREELAYSGAGRSVDDVQWIHTSAHQLLEIINSILDLSKIEAGKMDLDIHEFDPARVLAEVGGMLEPIAAQRGNSLHVMVDPGLPNMKSDSVKLRQCLLNLGSNACKFTEGGQIFINAVGQGDDVVISVSDTGIGMAPEQLDKLFQPFVQADASTTRRYGGTGLGLTITWRFAQMLEGDINVDSEPAEGSTFTLRVKRDLTSIGTLQAPARPVEVRPLDYTRNDDAPLALIIDDQPSAVQLLSRFASRAGYQTVSASDGGEGLELARKHKPDLIMLDLGLPRMNGWEVLEALDEDGELQAIPTVVVTVDDDRRRTLAAGAADHLVKPVSQEDINDILVQYAKRHMGRILIVEDDVGTANLYQRGLSQMGYDTRIALSGSAAREMLEVQDFAFVVTDLRMPDGNGFDLVDTIAAMPDLVRPKVIVVTGKVLNDTESRQLEGKIVRLLPKNGLSPRKLGGSVREVMERNNLAPANGAGRVA